ncbi:hypothetical protein [Streptomyces sp. BBFR102]|uniref:hypothetical protein n=1 Tax=Streptomyces sp. BBFR102 TaxID=3448171 RepID=UPI003F52FD23
MDPVGEHGGGQGAVERRAWSSSTPATWRFDVTELAWREADRPYLTHQAGFAPNVAAAIAPVSAQQASASYQARYDEAGFLRATARNAARPFADRAAQIQAMAERLLGGRTERARTASPPSAPPQTAVPHPPAPVQRLTTAEPQSVRAGTQGANETAAMLRTELGRADSKASLLLALTGAGLAGIASAAPQLDLPATAEPAQDSRRAVKCSRYGLMASGRLPPGPGPPS